MGRSVGGEEAEKESQDLINLSLAPSDLICKLRQRFCERWKERVKPVRVFFLGGGGVIFNKDHCSPCREPVFLPLRAPPTPTPALLKQLGYFLQRFVLALSEYCSREIRAVKYSSVGAFALSRMSSFHTEPPAPNFIPGADYFGCMCTQMQQV